MAAVGAVGVVGAVSAGGVVSSVGAVGAAVGEGLEGGLGDRSRHEVEHQAGGVTVEGLGQGFGIGIPVAGERDGLRARCGGAFQA